METPNNYASETLIKSLTEKGKLKWQNLWREEKYNLDRVLHKEEGWDRNDAKWKMKKHAVGVGEKKKN